jgi:hypothetical protein
MCGQLNRQGLRGHGGKGVMFSSFAVKGILVIRYIS